jgi:predicted transcriptional regulator
VEKAGILSSTTKAGLGGPRRRVYSLNKSFSMILDVAPHLYNEKAVAFEVSPDKDLISMESVSFMDRMDEFIEYTSARAQYQAYQSH